MSFFEGSEAEWRSAFENVMLPPDFYAPKRRLSTFQAFVYIAVSVFVIAQQRESDGAKMGADLMGASGNQRHFKEADMFDGADQAIVRFDGQRARLRRMNDSHS